ncbi:hypothetical protein KA005_40755 [bacterium]|nr:hypothetical protein [bacterium]
MTKTVLYYNHNKDVDALGEIKDYLKRLWNHAKNLGYSCFFAGITGLFFRKLVNQAFTANNQLVKTGIPYDEIIRPPVVYLTLLILDKLIITDERLRKLGFIDNSSIVRRYLPHILTLICWSVIWESSEYLTILPEIIKGISPTILGTIKDIIMDLVTILLYK